MCSTALETALEKADTREHASQHKVSYVDAGLSRALTGERYGSITLGFAAGVGAGQATDARGRDLAYFDRDGLTSR